MEDVSLPAIFYPETTDIYDRKNIPRLIYCLHALSLYLFKLGKAPQIQDLYGKIKFTGEASVPGSPTRGCFREIVSDVHCSTLLDRVGG